VLVLVLVCGLAHDERPGFVVRPPSCPRPFFSSRRAQATPPSSVVDRGAEASAGGEERRGSAFSVHF